MERFVVEPSLSVADLGEELMIYDSRNGNVRVLNKTARFIWECLKSDTPVSHVVSRIEASFETADPRAVHSDVIEIIGIFQKEGLVTSYS